MSLNEDIELAKPTKSESGSTRWWFGNKLIPREEVVFFCQMGIITLIVVVGLVNLCLKNGTESYWAAMVATGLGSLLPSPKIKKQKVHNA